MQLFWVAAFVTPTKKDRDEGASGEIVLQPKCVLAPDAEKARVVASKDLSADLPLERLELVVRPF